MRRQAWWSLALLLLSAPAGALGLPDPGSATPETLTLPSGPNSVRGLADDPTVSSFTGQVSYSVPIALPQAANGFAPALSLSYSGALGNGPIGIGWRLAFPVIERSLRFGVPTYSDADELELLGVERGGRLIAIGGGQWRVMGEGNWWQITSVNGGFLAIDGDGHRYTLGQTTTGRQSDGGTRVSSWLPESLVDVAGQEVDFTWTHDQGEVYLTMMSWGPSQSFRAQLVYAARPDAVVSYRRGYRVATALRLSEVRAWSFGAIRTNHRLAYDNSFPLSRLVSVTELGSDNATSWPVTSFQYATPVTPQAFDLANTGGWVVGQAGVSMLDIDGDGMSDLVQMFNNSHSWRRNRGGTFDAARAITGASTASLATGRIIDLDGDAKPELATVVGGMWQSYKLTGEQWLPLGAGGVWPGSSGLPLIDPTGAVLFADVNGDARTDVIKASGAGLWVYFNTASGLAAPTIVGAVSPGEPGVAPGQRGVRVQDVNGDGLADFLWLSTTGVKTYLGRGDGTFEAQALAAYPWTDGATDIDHIQFADLNRDGLLDLVRITGANVSLYFGRPGGLFDATAHALPTPAGVDSSVIVTLADANGNGSQDVLWCTPTKMSALDLAGPTSAGMLGVVHNGLGKTVSFGYQASAVLAMSDENAGSPWIQKLPMSIPVPITVATDPGAGDPLRLVGYAVRDAFWDPIERRFGGFLEARKIVDSGLPTQRVEVTHYIAGLSTARVLRGKPLWVRVELAGVPVGLTNYTWQALAIDGLDSTNAYLHRAGLMQQQELRYEGVTTPLEVDTTFVYDGEGRPIEEHHQGRSDRTGDETWLQRSFASDASSGVRDRVYDEKVLHADGTVAAEKRTYFGDSTLQLPLGQVGKGWVREVDEWLHAYAAGESDRWVATSRFSYNALGNPIRSEKHGIAHTLDYDSYGLHPVRETVQPSATSSLSWTMSWNNVLGQAATLTDPNGVTTQASYDALGRVVGIAHAGQPAHIVYAYDWTAPRPRTHTYVFDGPATALTAFAGVTAPGAWREDIAITNGASEPELAATRLSASRWIVRDWRRRDNRGRITGLAEPFYFDGADVPTSLPTTAVLQTVAWDALDRWTLETLPTGVTRKRSYSAFAMTETSSGLAPVRFSFDGQDRPVHTERTIGSLTETVDATYDEQGRITLLSLQNGQAQHQLGFDSLGRLRKAQNPDMGLVTMDYDDGGRLVGNHNAVGASATMSYDGAGRIGTLSMSDGTRYVYHYDAGKLATQTNLLGRVAWAEEPTGEVDFSYDGFGRQSWFQRTVNGRSAHQATAYSPSGLILAQSFDDSVPVAIGYDGAGRATTLGSYWQAATLDAGGRPLDEKFGNGVEQLSDRDPLGALARVRVLGGNKGLLYDVAVTRNSFGAISKLVDQDAVGLDHSATFSYDSAGRLSDELLGPATGGYHFSYSYDGLQNMISRGASGPRAVGVSVGTYKYGESAGPRQLTSVVNGATVTHFGYDAAGREISTGDSTMVYSAADQLLRVLDLTGKERVEHAYGFDGLRVYSKLGSGAEQRWLTPQIVERNGVRQYYLQVGGRQLARLQGPLPATAPPATTVGHAGFGGGSLPLTLLLGAAFLALGLRARRRPGWQRVGSLLALLALTPSCVGGGAGIGESAPAAITATDTLYLHQGIAAGPSLFTHADGTLAEERRYEPFGQPLDAANAAHVVAAVDLTLEPRNELNKETDPATGWSYHGARWLAPQTARWLTPDPPTKAPGAKFMLKPWTLHPYQYVSQNPVAFWDPDGRDEVVQNKGVRMPVWGAAMEDKDGVKIGFAQVQAGIDPQAESAKVDLKVGALDIKMPDATAIGPAVPGGNPLLSFGWGTSYFTGSAGASVGASNGVQLKGTIWALSGRANVLGAQIKLEGGVQANFTWKLGLQSEFGVGPASISVDVSKMVDTFSQLGQRFTESPAPAAAAPPVEPTPDAVPDEGGSSTSPAAEPNASHDYLDENAKAYDAMQPNSSKMDPPAGGGDTASDVSTPACGCSGGAAPAEPAGSP